MADNYVRIVKCDFNEYRIIENEIFNDVSRRLIWTMFQGSSVYNRISMKKKVLIFISFSSFSVSLFPYFKLERNLEVSDARNSLFKAIPLK